MIDTTAVNVATDISKVALICQWSKNTKGGCLEAESVLFVNYWTITAPGTSRYGRSKSAGAFS